MNDGLPLDLKKDELGKVQQILKHYIPDTEVRAFGSRVNGTAKKYSDLDLIVMSKIPLTLQQNALLTEAFEESDLPFKVDVLDWSVASDRFRKILNDKGLSQLIN
ncbi:MAG: nucleotidyltransferase domain-containing protein [Methylococcaceae bacterium]